MFNQTARVNANSQSFFVAYSGTVLAILANFLRNPNSSTRNSEASAAAVQLSSLVFAADILQPQLHDAEEEVERPGLGGYGRWRVRLRAVEVTTCAKETVEAKCKIFEQSRRVWYIT